MSLNKHNYNVQCLMFNAEFSMLLLNDQFKLY